MYPPNSALDFRGGDPFNILENVRNAGYELQTQGCYSYDQFAGDPEFKHPSIKGLFNAKKSEVIFKAIEELYHQARLKLKLDDLDRRRSLGGPDIANHECDDCIAKLQSLLYDIGKVQTEERILKALKWEEFPIFLYRALFHDCFQNRKKISKAQAHCFISRGASGVDLSSNHR